MAIQAWWALSCKRRYAKRITPASGISNAQFDKNPQICNSESRQQCCVYPRSLKLSNYNEHSSWPTGMLKQTISRELCTAMLCVSQVSKLIKLQWTFLLTNRNAQANHIERALNIWKRDEVVSTECTLYSGFGTAISWWMIQLISASLKICQPYRSAYDLQPGRWLTLWSSWRKGRQFWVSIYS